MPFQLNKAANKVNQFTFTFNGQTLKGKYNAGEKYKELEANVEALIAEAGVDKKQISRMVTPAEAALVVAGLSEDENTAYERARWLQCTQIAAIMVEWDVKDEGGDVVPITPSTLNDLPLPMDFFQGLSEAIGEDLSNGGKAADKR